jgi:hypothetical protein
VFFSCCDSVASLAADKSLGIGPGTTSKHVRRTASGVAGNGLGTTIKYLRRLTNGFSSNGLGTTAKYLKQLPRATAWPSRSRIQNFKFSVREISAEFPYSPE